MGHKVHPKVFRMQVIYKWPSRWFAKLGSPEFINFLREDTQIRDYLRRHAKAAGIDDIIIERDHAGNITLTLTVAKPGLIIGRGGSGIEELVRTLEAKVLKGLRKVRLNIQEIKNPSLSCHVIADGVVAELEKRVPFRRVMKQTIGRVQKAGAKGARIMVSGRLNGAEIARRETLSWGKIPLQKLRADIDYANHEAYTTYGVIGVKVWIYRGDIFDTPSSSSS